MNNVIAFKKVKAPYGWMSNMSAHPMVLGLTGEHFHTAEHMFQAMRHSDPEIRKAIREPKSPMAAKMVAKKYLDQTVIKPRTQEDLFLMELVLRCKLQAHPHLLTELLATGTATIIEDVSSRMNDSGIYWGAGLVDGVWVGVNNLGKLWMQLRSELVTNSTP